MERLKVWLNQQTAKILGDLQEREPVEDPSPMRAGCRIFFMVSLLLGFSLLLVYTFIDAPDARVVQIHRLTPGDENHAFPSCFLYDRNSPNCTKWSKAKFPEGIPVSCLCTNPSAPWRHFVKFHLLHENSTDRNMPFTTAELFLYLESSTSWLPGIKNIVKGNGNLTAEDFCDLSYLWIIANNSTTIRVTNATMLYLNCVWMASLLFPGPNDTSLMFTSPNDTISLFPNKYFEDRTRSTQFLNTPSLLNREEFNTLLAKLARESVLKRRLALDMASSLDVGNDQRFYNGLAHLLIGLLDRDEMGPSESFIYGAQELYDTLISNLFLAKKSMVWYLGDHAGPIFLQPEIDWEAYHQTCYPIYCEVLKPMRGEWKLYWAFGILGGVATIVLAVVTMLVWPCTAMLLLWFFKRKIAEKGVLETPLVARPQPVELSSPLDSKTIDSKPQHAELSNPLDPKTPGYLNPSLDIICEYV